MAKKVVWNEKISATEYNTLYPRTVAEQIVLNNTINNNLGIDIDSKLDVALEHISDTDKRIRAQGVSTGTAKALELSVPVFTLLDGIMARVKIHTDTAEGATLNVNATGAKPIIRIDGEPIDLVLKQGTWCIFIYSSTLDSWVFEGWSTKTVVKSAIFTESGSWTVPANVTSVDVFLMGGGGGAGGNLQSQYSYGGGGGAGRLKKQTITVTPGQSIAVTIGSGGGGGVHSTGLSAAGNGGNGGTTSFGALLSVAGGDGGKGATQSKGGDGGAGSAGGGGGSCAQSTGGSGGNGEYCGGGGAGSAGAKGGNGGTYGGGGGAMTGSKAAGGQYGGAGGVTAGNLPAVAGTNTVSMAIEFTGEGKAGANGITKYDDTGSLYYGGGGGGGGYGGNGGDGGYGEKSLDQSADTYGASGGGGGYGGDGYGYSNSPGMEGGGGGGYGGDATGSGGGGYGASNYGRGGNTALSNDPDRNGKSGIAILTWTAQET